MSLPPSVLEGILQFQVLPDEMKEKLHQNLKEVGLLFQAHQIGKSDVLPWVRNFYLTHDIPPKVHVLLLNTGCLGCRITLL